ncbi:unnamed protein product [Polarella glacialis]|uniref:Sulfotransferase domain-containing protein n=1 Tax=Polarella glacialis TaxID=89957 RepID=A0A813J8H2_POLGL|nr:unnamed protein product [Polarella glacialis]
MGIPESKHACCVGRKSAPAEEVEIMDEFGYKHVVIRGVVYPGFVRGEAVADCQSNLVLRSDDIIIATYPKCGTTWMQQIVMTLLHGGDVSKVQDPMFQAPWIESITSMSLGAAEGTNGAVMNVDELMAWDGATAGGPKPGRRAFKTHAPVELVPWKGGLGILGGPKVIVVVRNPKDACVSMYHHTKDLPGFAYTGDFGHFTSSLFLRGRVEFGCFWAWYAGWLTAFRASGRAIHLVSYEELKADPKREIRQIADFLGITASDEVVAKTAAGSAFDSMKEIFKKTDEEKEKAGSPVKKNHIRSGQKGGWRNVIQGPLLAEFDEVHARKCAELGLTYNFEF